MNNLQNIKNYERYQNTVYRGNQEERYSGYVQYESDNVYERMENLNINQQQISASAQEQLPFAYIWTQPPVPDFLDPRQSIDLKLIKKRHKKDTRCYTCKPRGKVKKHIINTSESGKFYFHHDMHKRAIILMTPLRHIESIDEMNQEELADLFKSIKNFTSFWNIPDYQVSFNTGAWKNHDHFHIKLRISEKIIDRMRRDHFKLVKMSSVYDNR